MAFKIFRWFANEPEVIEEVRELPVVKRTHRIGMDKNFRIGRVKRVSNDRTKALIDVLEMCKGSDDQTYDTHYNLWLHFDDKWQSKVSKDLTGQWVVIGFYIQAFRDKDLSDKFDTITTCRFINIIPSEEEAKSLAIDLMESKLFVDHYYLKLSNIKVK
jgi:hypothetical protein